MDFVLNMKFLVLIVLCSTIYAYEDIDENEHFENVLKMPDELKKQLYCYLDKGPCSDLAAHHKSHMEQSIIEGCEHCTANHKHNIHLFIKAAKETFPELYKEIVKKYDPQGKYYDHLIEEVDAF